MGQAEGLASPVLSQEVYQSIGNMQQYFSVYSSVFPAISAWALPVQGIMPTFLYITVFHDLSSKISLTSSIDNLDFGHPQHTV